MLEVDRLSKDAFKLSTGTLDVPETWEVRTQVTLLEPEDKTLSDPMLLPSTSAPRANLVVSRQAHGNTSPEDALEDFLKHSAREIPQLRVLGKENLEFDDGGHGASVSIAFPATAAVQLAQRHVFRVDDGTLTQIVITVDDYRANELDTALRELARSFRP